MTHHFQGLLPVELTAGLRLFTDQWRSELLVDPLALPAILAQLQGIQEADIADRTAKVQASTGNQMQYVLEGDIARLDLQGPLSKNGSSLSGAGSLTAGKHSLRKAGNDPAAKAILVKVTSPGGTWAGTSEFAEEVAAVARKKPVWMVGEDLMASAGYLVAAPASRIWMNRSGTAGSIGVYTTLVDSSQQATEEGLKVHLVKFGRDKGIGAEGVPITESQIAVIQERIDQIGQMFIEIVSAGRRRSIEDVTSWATGRTYSAEQCLQMGLIDQVGGIEEAMAALADLVSGKKSVSVSTNIGVKAMDFKSILAACEGIDPKLAADQAFLSNLQLRDNLDAATCTSAWCKELTSRAAAAQADATRIRTESADAVAKATAEAATATASLKHAPGGNKAPQGDTEESAKADGGETLAAVLARHPFMAAVRENATLHKVTLREAFAVTVQEQPGLHRAFVLASPQNKGADRLYAAGTITE